MSKIIYNSKGFTVVVNNNRKGHLDRLKELYKLDDCGTLGKYLVFSDNRRLLMQIGEEIVNHYGLSTFLVSNKDNENGMFSYVLKIPDYIDNHSRSIKEYLIRMSYIIKVEYRYFKRETATRNNIYSNEFLSRNNP